MRKGGIQRGLWPTWHPVHAMCEPWSQSPLFLLLFYRRRLLKPVVCSQADGWGPRPICAFCPPSRGLGKPSFLQGDSAGTKWNLMESSVHRRRPFCCSYTENRLRGRTLAGKQVAFGPPRVGLTFHSEEFTLK